MPVSTLLVQRRLKGRDARAVFIGGGWIEYIRLEKGALVKSSVKSCPGLSGAALPDSLTAAFGPCGEGSPPVDLFCTGADKALLGADKRWTFHLLENISCPEHSFSLYPQASSGLKRRKALALLLGLCLGTAGLCLLSQYRERTEQETARLRREEEERNRLVEREYLAEQELEELKRNYASLMEHKKPSVYEGLELVARRLGEETLILSAVFKEGFFQFEAVSPDALKVLALFEGRPRIDSPMLGQTRPQDGLERFTLSGGILPRREDPGPELPLGEQRKILERLIGELERPVGSGLSPASFGRAIRSLLQKWQCPVINYQFLNKGGGGEMEFTVRGQGAGFFHFLREASAGVPLTDDPAGPAGGVIFTQVQIRSLRPQNAVEAVFRVTCPVLRAGTENRTAIADTGAAEEDAPLSAPRIGRNYAPPRKQAGPPEPVPPPQASLTTPPQTPPAAAAETAGAHRFEYLGTVSGSRGQLVYIKNAGTGAILALKPAEGEGIAEGSCRTVKTGTIAARINGKLYEMGIPGAGLESPQRRVLAGSPPDRRE
jgi:hypothetical protein